MLVKQQPPGGVCASTAQLRHVMPTGDVLCSMPYTVFVTEGLAEVLCRYLF